MIRHKMNVILCIARSLLDLKQSAIMCLIVKSVPQVWQMGGSSLTIRKPCVILVWSIRSLLRTVSSFRLSFAFVQQKMSLLISFNFVFCMFQILCHLFFIYSFMSFFESSYDIWFIIKVSLLLMAIEACSSAISLPFMPECPGIHMMIICLLKSAALFRFF
jgi:hypothetical protein